MKGAFRGRGAAWSGLRDAGDCLGRARVRAADSGRIRRTGERREQHEQRRSKFIIKSPNDFSLELQCGKQDLNLHELNVH